MSARSSAERRAGRTARASSRRASRATRRASACSAASAFPASSSPSTRSVGFSIYFALGVVADRGLGLTPLIFLAAGLLFVLTTLSYVEGGAMLRERGGSSSFARHAFNELIAFIAGWAILIDYLIVVALAAISVPHYLEPISGDFSEPGWEIGVAVAGDRRRLRPQRAQHHRPRPRSAASRSSRSPTSPCSWR